MKLYKIKDLAKLLKIPESTVRYYRDRHPEFFPYTGKKRKKRYKEQALEALRLIIDSSDSAENIEEALSLKFTRNIEATQNSSSRAVAETQNFESVELLARTLERLTDITERLVKLEEHRSLPWWKKIGNKKTKG